MFLIKSINVYIYLVSWVDALVEYGLFVEASALLLAALDGVEVLRHHQEQVVRQDLRANPVLAQVTWSRQCWITTGCGFH